MKEKILMPTIAIYSCGLHRYSKRKEQPLHFEMRRERKRRGMEGCPQPPSNPPIGDTTLPVLFYMLYIYIYTQRTRRESFAYSNRGWKASGTKGRKRFLVHGRICMLRIAIRKASPSHASLILLLYSHPIRG